MKSTAAPQEQGLRPALPGALFVGVVLGIVSAFAVNSGAASVFASAQISVAIWSVVSGLIGFVGGAFLMVFAYRMSGFTIGSIAKAVTALWEAFGKWQF